MTTNRKNHKRTEVALGILLEARDLIASGERSFICFAIDDAAVAGFYGLSDEMKARVMDSIAPCGSFRIWALRHGMHEDTDTRAMRLAYLDAWIKKHEDVLRKKRGAA